MTSSRCRLCNEPLVHVVADLGMTPISNDYVPADRLDSMEPYYPLCAYVCEHCLLVQVGEFAPREEIFADDYAYFSSYSTSWVEHARRYVDAVAERFAPSEVVEIASNDGYLLQWFVERGVPVLGVDPTAGTAAAAEERGVPTVVEFFGRELATRLAASHAPDLMIGNNVLAHVPDLNDFVGGFRRLLAPHGVVTFEFPHLVSLIEEGQFDTIYHEHFSYFSLLSASSVLAAHGLVVFDVEELPTHGGSLRVYARHVENDALPIGERVRELLARERADGYDTLGPYLRFADRVRADKRRLLEFFVAAKEEGKTIAAYGAPAKGNTLLNYCAIGTDFIDFTVDLNPAKQGRFLPGTHIPIDAPERLAAERPDLIFLLPWNLRDELSEQLAYVRDWGARLVVRAPDAEAGVEVL
ncbi:MAG TPA: class I SAM-dependent methyltransferase [Gaiellaceae bacterium]|jgi:SAM-dependent methyltransferase|nr:class I SAM-dependent methyltransferase [Gaiellaceae bacterium]